MINRHSLSGRLETIRQVFRRRFHESHDELRQAIPENEVWRFAVERIRQKHGRLLERVIPGHFEEKKIPNEYSQLSIKEFVEEYEGVSITSQEDWDKTGFAEALSRRCWKLNEKQWRGCTLDDLIQLDRGWLPFEVNEPNYFEGFYRGFNLIFDLNQELCVDLILSIHAAATTRVEGLASGFSEADSGEFRQAKERAFLLWPQSAVSAKGLHEYIATNDELDHFIALQFYFPEARRVIDAEIRINKNSLSAISNYYSNPGKYKNQLPFAKYIDASSRYRLSLMIKQDQRISVIFESIGSKNLTEASEFIFQMVKTQPELYGLEFTSSQSRVVSGMLKQYFHDKTQGFIDEYHDRISKEISPLKQLECIALFVQKLELLHPFADANGRTICMLLLNFLLMKNGFLPAVLNDSNRFNIYSTDEMVEELVKGMENTLNLVEQKKLFNFSSENLYQNLSSQDVISDKIDYMNRLIEREKQFRQQKGPSLNQ